MKIYFFNKQLYMSTISQIRRNNLSRLREHVKNQFEQNPQKEGVRFTDGIFCEYIGISTSTLSQLKKSKHKPYFNEIYARRIESNVKLELGWFDIDRDNTDFNLIKINFEQFSLGLDSFNEFMASKKITINDDESLENLKKNLFLYLFKETNAKITSISSDNFFDFLKK